MKSVFIVILFLTAVCISFGQNPGASPTPTATPTEKNRTKTFGSSLEKYEKKKRRDAQTEQESNATNDEVIRVETDLVVNDVLVTNQKGNIILGLKKEDFIVTEDGIRQTIEMFSSSEKQTVPRSIVLIIDNLALQAPFLKRSIEAAKILVDKLAPQDKMAIATVDLKLRMDFTQDKTHLKKTLDFLEKKEMEIWGGWEFTTLLAVLNEMFDKQDGQRIVIFQGDGSQIIWLKPDKDAPYPVSYSTLEKSGLRYTREKYLPKFGFSEVKEAIEKSGATVYSVIPGIRFFGLSKEEQLAQAKITLTESSKFFGWKNLSTTIREFQWAEAERRTAGQAAMFKIAELSGGFTDFLEKPEDAENVYSNIFTVVENRYVIGYYPINQKRDGKRREVKIEVRGHPEYVVTGQKAYYFQ